jgi:hypothetical protein
MNMLATRQPTAAGTRLTKPILAPGNAGFEDLALPWNRAHRHSPAFVGIPESAADVVDLIRFARSRDLSIGVQATGHGVTRPVVGGLLILTHRLDSIRIDANASVCRLGAGVQWGPVLEAAQQHGLAPLLGSSPNVGAVGYTLGGGLGWLTRLHGLASDSVVSFEVATVDGRLIPVSAEENPELFWGLRGGGAGSLVIVTSMEVRLFGVTTVYGGNLLYPAEMAREVLARWRDWVPTVPNELTSSVLIKKFPALDHIPAPLRGRAFAIVRGCFAGDSESGGRLLADWRDWRRPEIDDWKTMPFAEVATIASDPVNPSAGRMSGGWLRELSNHAIDVLVTRTLDMDSRVGSAEVRHIGGAVSARAASSSAYGNRDSELILTMGGGAPTPEANAALLTDLDSVFADLAGDRTGGVFLNFLDGENRRSQSAAGVSSAARMMRLKATFDPTDVMSHGLDFAS